MFRSALTVLAVPLALLTLVTASGAEASRPPLLHTGADGRITAVSDSLPEDLPILEQPAKANAASLGRATNSSVVGYAIRRMLATHAITSLQASDATATWTAAVRTRRKLHGTPGAELENVIAAIAAITNRHALTPSRLPMLMLTAKRNTEFFSHGRTPNYHQRVTFDTSDLVWQYYPGQGLQLQVLATFGVANGLWRANLPGHLRTLLDEMLALRANRAGGSAWEYTFSWDGGSPPWTSSMSQSTGIQAMARGAELLKEPKYLRAAKSALAIFAHPTPSGVRVNTARGPWYVMYSFDASGRILNGFLQTLVGLNEMAVRGSNSTASRLFNSAEPVARAAIPDYIRSGWSYYSPGVWSTTSYQSLTAGFLDELCQRTLQPIYCRSKARLDRFPAAPPRLAVRTHRVATGKPSDMTIWISKPASISITVRVGRRLLKSFHADWSPGYHRLEKVPIPHVPGTLRVRVVAVDYTGHSATVTGTVQAVHH
ncbi:MAG: D-glucuronyl C5-epimerase family protein [Actinomycetes bacterium]